MQVVVDGTIEAIDGTTSKIEFSTIINEPHSHAGRKICAAFHPLRRFRKSPGRQGLQRGPGDVQNLRAPGFGRFCAWKIGHGH
jgi:hypothetical protein